jgi:hypothetical protein
MFPDSPTVRAFRTLAAPAALRPPAEAYPPLARPRPGLLPLRQISAFDFECLTAVMAVEVDALREARLFGRSGRGDHGIDVLATDNGVTYRAFQCKNVEKFTGSDLRRAVEIFLTDPPFPIDAFTVAVACEVDGKLIQPELDKLRAMNPWLRLDLRDGRELSRLLRDRPSIVEAAFGSSVRRDFCGDEPAREGTRSVSQISIAGHGATVIQVGGDFHGGFPDGQRSVPPR